MNYRTLAKGALALSLSLIVGSAMAATTTADVQKYGATFESVKNTTAGELNDYAYEVGTNITKYAVTDGNPSGWFGAAEDESKIIVRTDAAAGQALQLNTDAGVLTNKLESTIATDVNNNGIAKAGAFIETEAKFVASDTLDAGVVGGTDDTKFAIYAYADESKSPCTTNLVVYHAYYDGNGDLAYTNEVFDTLVDCDAYTKLRVEMKKMTNPANGQPANVFSVRVGNSTTLTSENAFDAYLDENLSAGNWFLTVEDQLGGSATKQLSSVTFKGTGEVDNLSVGIIEERYTVGWAGSEKVVVSNATEALTGTTATVAPATVITFYPNEGNVITNVFVGGVAQTFDPASYAITVNSDTNVVVLAGTQAEPPAPATVITIAQVGNVNVEDNNGTLTFTAPEGYTISSIYTNGVNTFSTSSFTTNGLTGNVNIVVAAKKNRPAVAHKWYENPTIVGTTAHGLATGGTYGIWHLNGDGDYIAGTSWATQDNMVKVYDVDALVAGTASPVISNRYDLTSKKYVWGAAVSMALNTVFVGSYAGDESPQIVPALAYPLNVAEGTMGVDSFVISNDQGIAIYDAEFTADGQYLYAASYYPTASRQYVYKFRVLNGLKSSGMNLEYVEKYDFGQRIRSIGLGQFTDKDVVYALLNDKTVKYVDTSAAEPVATELISEYTVLGGNYGDVVVSGADTETPHITIFGSNSSKTAYSIDVYTLTTTGTLASSNPVLALDTKAVAALGLPNSQFGFSGFVTENEETLILSWGTSNLYAIQWTEPPTPTVITVACVNGAEYTEADGVYTFSAPNGYTVSSVFTNGVSAKTTSSLDLSAAEGDIKVIVAATKTRTAPTHKWYENPGVVGTNTYCIGGSDNYYGPYNMDVDGDFIAVPMWPSNPAYLELYSRDAIDAGSATYLARFTQSNYDYRFMGSGLCVPLNIAIAGNYSSGSHVIAFPLNNPNPVLGVDAFVISNSLNATLTQFKFTDDAQYVYARPYSGTKVYKFKVLNGLKTTGVNFVEPKTYEFNQRVRSFELAQIGGKDIVYALLEDKTISVVDTSVASPEAAPLVSEAALGKYINISVSGIADGTPHLTVASCTHTTTRVDVYTLNAAGTAIDTSIEKKSFDTAAVTKWGVEAHDADGCDAVVVDDEGTLYLGYGSELYAIKYVEPAVPTYAVNWTGSDGVTATTNNIALAGTSGTFEENTVITFTPDQNTTITNILVDGVAQTGFDPSSFALTVVSDTNIVVLAGVQSQPQGYNYPEGGAAITNADQLAWITAKGFTQGNINALGSNAKFNECYLLNCNITAPGAGGSIAITGITVDAQGVHVTVALTRSGAYANEGINGTLKLQGTADLATAPATLTTDVSVDNAKFTTDGPATATFTGTGATFFKAIVE